MRDWLKDHLVEIAALIISSGGAVALWERLLALAKLDAIALLFLVAVAAFCGLLAGWRINKWWESRPSQRMCALSPMQLSAIAHMLKSGSVVSAPHHSALEREMESLLKLGYADMVELAHSVSYWSLSPDVTREASKDGKFYKLVKESMLLGRFAKDGSYVKYSDTKTVMLKAAMKKHE